MFQKRSAPPQATPALPAGALARIGDEARALHLPQSSLYSARVRERQRAHEAEVSAIDGALETARTEGFAAAIRLMSLDAPERVLFSTYTDVVNRQGEM